MIDSKAYVHPDAKIGKDVTISPFAYVGENTEIGDGTVIMPNAVILEGARIGKNCRIFPGAVISAIPQDLKFRGENTTAEIGDNTTIRECVTVNRGTTDKNTSRVGANCLLMAYVHVAHDVIIGDGCILANSVNIAGHVEMEDHVTVEGVVAIQQFVKIGAYSFIAGGSLVRKNVPPFVKAAREPLSYVGINAIGLRRKGLEDGVVEELGNIYRTLFVHQRNLTKGLEAVKSDYEPSPHRDRVIEFIENSQKGVIKGAG